MPTFEPPPPPSYLISPYAAQICRRADLIRCDKARKLRRPEQMDIWHRREREQTSLRCRHRKQIRLRKVRKAFSPPLTHPPSPQPRGETLKGRRLCIWTIIHVLRNFRALRRECKRSIQRTRFWCPRSYRQPRNRPLWSSKRFDTTSHPLTSWSRAAA